MKQIEKCPFIESKNPKCEIPPCNSCYLNCVHKPYDLNNIIIIEVNKNGK